MTSKKPAAPKRTAAKAKAVTVPSADPRPASRRVWTLPIAMVMLVVGAGGLWLAARESSNAPLAAAPAVMAPEGPVSATASVKSEKRTMAAPAETAKDSDATTVRATGKPTSITGCLQKVDDGFVLKNVEGSDAPRSRSWKTGFFKKSAATLELLDPSKVAHMAQHVGHRVSVTGSLADRELRVQSLRPMAGSCQ